MSPAAALSAEEERQRPAAPRPPLRMTFEEFLDWADEDTWAEWVDGEVIFLTAAYWHQRVADFLAALVQHWVEEQGLGGAACTAPFLMHCAPGMPGREPDLLYLAPEHMDRLRASRIEGPADLVVEIVSPESERRDRDEKYFEYERGGVREYWIIDLEAQQAEFYRRDDSDGAFRRVAPDAEGVYRSAVLSGFPLTVAWLWQRPLPTLMSVLRAWGFVPPAAQ
jgi:Uncharacterized protein conserved in cyanobacteria